MTIAVIGLLLAGLVLLVAGAEALVRGSSRLAARFGVPPLIIGLTIVAYGTSSPEMVVSAQASLAGQTGIALGNVVGSNIFNTLFILGISALVAPLVVAQQLIRLDVPIMIGVSGLLLLFGLDGEIQSSEGVVLAVGAAAYTLFQIYQGRKETDPEVQAEYAREYGGNKLQTFWQWGLDLGFIGVGLALLVVGSQWLVESSITIARVIGVSDLVIGLTIVAAGTSLPELATSVIASIKNERDIAVGNVVGSNIFNILAVLGASATLSSTGLDVPASAVRFDIPVMIASAIACLPIFATGNRIARWEGLLFTGYYVLYAAYLILAATAHDSLPVFSWVFFLFVVPITLITFGLITQRALQQRRLRQNDASPD